VVDEPAGMPGEPAGDVQEPVAQPLRLAAGELAVGEQEPLLWLMALAPAFLLAFYRGWRGASVALGSKSDRARTRTYA
jgi:hypothetical protein